MGVMYFNELHCSDGCVLSVDMLTVNGKFYGRAEDVQARFWALVRPAIFIDCVEWISCKLGSYRYQHTVTCLNGCSFWFGIGFNSPDASFSETCNKWRIEFNPNKVFTEYLFLKTFLSFIQLSKHIEIKRFDLAIDYPVNRKSCFLVKDGRTYSEYMNSLEDRTQNLGQHSHHGYVKLYNKQIESKLPIPLTRLEITMDFLKSNYDEFQRIFPKVYVVESFQMKLDENTLNDTDKFILFTCLDNPTNVKLLGRRKQKRIESIMTQYSRFLRIDRKDYMSILAQIPNFVKPSFLFQYFPDCKEIPKLNEFYDMGDFVDDFAEDEIAVIFGNRKGGD